MKKEQTLAQQTKTQKGGEAMNKEQTLTQAQHKKT